MKYYAISQNDNNRVTHNFPDSQYAKNWFKCPTNKEFIEWNDIVIVSEDKYFLSSKY